MNNSIKEGFIKRAQEYGLTVKEGEALFKRVKVANEVREQLRDATLNDFNNRSMNEGEASALSALPMGLGGMVGAGVGALTSKDPNKQKSRAAIGATLGGALGSGAGGLANYVNRPNPFDEVADAEKQEMIKELGSMDRFSATHVIEPGAEYSYAMNNLMDTRNGVPEQVGLLSGATAGAGGIVGAGLGRLSSNDPKKQKTRQLIGALLGTGVGGAWSGMASNELGRQQSNEMINSAYKGVGDYLGF